MYEIRRRPAFVNYVQGARGSRGGEAAFDSDLMKRYYSSLDLELYFSGIYIDEIVHLQYTAAQNVLPLFGFNSYVYDEVALGSRLIQGSFAINFTRPRYLFDIIETIGQSKGFIGNNYQLSKDRENIPEEKKSSLNNSQSDQSKGPIWNAGFEIDIVYGESTDVNESKYITLEGVVITNCSKQVGMDGSPVLEQYQFIARDIRPN